VVPFTAGSRDFLSSPKRPDALVAQPASYLMDTGGFLSGVKQQGREDSHSPPSNA
jgi:hypothetical protein